MVLILQATPLGEENNANRDKNMASMFTAIFTLEIVLQFVVSGVKHFFRSKDGNWNVSLRIIDSSIVMYLDYYLYSESDLISVKKKFLCIRKRPRLRRSCSLVDILCCNGCAASYNHLKTFEFFAFFGLSEPSEGCRV